LKAFANHHWYAYHNLGTTVLERIAKDVRMSSGYSIIVDETSDISRMEQVSICLRFVI